MTKEILVVCDNSMVVDKVKAIKTLRSITGYDLKKSKKFFDEVSFGRSQVATLMNDLDDLQISHAISELESAGFQVHDVALSNRKKIKKSIEDAIALCIECGEYKTAKSLIDVLEQV